MYPEPLFHIYGMPVPLYHLIGIVAGLASQVIIWRLAAERGFAPRLRLDIWALAILSGLAGAHVLALLRFLVRAVAAGQAVDWRILFRGGLASMGGLVTVVAVVPPIVARIDPDRHMASEIGDVLVPGVALFQGIGRFACLAAGCCHGRPAYNLPWAIVLDHPRASCVFPGIPLHPTQLYLAFGNGAIVILLLLLRNRRAARGRLLPIYLLAYGLLRVTVEVFRGDPRPMIGPFSLYQLIAAAMAAAGALLLFRRRHSEPHPPLSPST